MTSNLGFYKLNKEMNNKRTHQEKRESKSERKNIYSIDLYVTLFAKASRESEGFHIPTFATLYTGG